MTEELMANFKRQKANFLDELKPTDFRNGGSFNQAEIIIDQLNDSLYKAVLNKKNSEGFIKKAVEHLFRQDSSAVEKAIRLSQIYLEIKLGKAHD